MQTKKKTCDIIHFQKCCKLKGEDKENNKNRWDKDEAEARGLFNAHGRKRSKVSRKLLGFGNDINLERQRRGSQI
jgi:hypothetical protein